MMTIEFAIVDIANGVVVIASIMDRWNNLTFVI